MALSAAIFGIAGTELNPREADFFQDVNPYGFILFARNCKSPKQIKHLVDELKGVTCRKHLPILIDQEGGRVARLKPPHWPEFPAAKLFADIYETDPKRAERACYLNARLIAHELSKLGITVDCAPVADLPVKGAHDVIGDRAFGYTPQQVIALAGAQAQGLMDGGVVPVLKHIPGHGRAFCDSHHELPEVHTPLEELRHSDFLPFSALSYLPMAMTAHVLYTAIDKKNIATVSPEAIRIIREEIGFKGLLMSDDLSMKAMRGNLTWRAKDALAAGCDVVLHCNGDMKEMEQVAKGIHPLAGAPLRRARAAIELIKPKPLKIGQAKMEIGSILSAVKADR